MAAAGETTPGRSRAALRGAGRVPGGGAADWAGRAEAEIAASGARRRPAGHDAATANELTRRSCGSPGAAAEGLTSREIAARSLLSAKTVDHHLGNIYRKLGRRSRRELIVRLHAQSAQTA